MQGVDGVDHTNPRSWKGDVSVKNVSLLTCWKSGWRTVKRLGTLLGVSFKDLDAIPNLDLLRPSNGSFVGLNDNFDYTGGAVAEEASTADAPSRSVTAPARETDEVAREDDTEDAGLELEDLLPEPDDANQDLDAVRKTDRYWLKVGEANIHKASAVRWFLGRKKDGRKSTDRTSRVAGLLKVRTYSRDPEPPKLDDDSVIGDKFVLGEYVATFLRIDKTVALAVVRVSEIVTSTHASVSVIDLAALESVDVTLRGQVLTLKQSSDNTEWVWAGDYESFHATDRAAGSKKSTIIDFLACLTKPIKIKLTHAARDQASSPVFSRSFEASVLDVMSDLLWDQVKPLAGRIPARGKTATFPMCGESGMSSSLIMS